MMVVEYPLDGIRRLGGEGRPQDQKQQSSRAPLLLYVGGAGGGESERVSEGN